MPEQPEQPEQTTLQKPLKLTIREVVMTVAFVGGLYATNSRMESDIRSVSEQTKQYQDYALQQMVDTNLYIRDQVKALQDDITTAEMTNEQRMSALNQRIDAILRGAGP